MNHRVYVADGEVRLEFSYVTRNRRSGEIAQNTQEYALSPEGARLLANELLGAVPDADRANWRVMGEPS